jgi:asparagine synthase (glutamine-hydrolysing)
MKARTKASEIKTIKTDAVNSSRKSISLSGFNLILPGNSITIIDDSIRIKRSEAKGPATDLKSEIRKAIQSCSQCTAVMASGGIDSSVIAATMRSEGRKTTILTTGMEGSEDLFYAEKLALELGAEFIPRIIKEDEIENIMRKLKQIGIYGYNVIIGVGEYTTMEKARESGITHIFNGLGSDELFFGFNMHRQIPFDELEDFRERRLSYLGAIDLDRVYRIAENFGISVHFPYLSDGVVNAALNTPIEENEEIYDKKPLRSIAMDLGLSSFIAGRKKRAFQYGTGVVKYLEKLAKKEKYENVGELIKRI